MRLSHWGGAEDKKGAVTLPLMHDTAATSQDSQQLWNQLDRYLEAHKGPILRPGHRIKFHWPPPQVSFEYRIPPSDFAEEIEFTYHGETFSAKVADTAHGFFARCEELWLEVKAESIEDLAVQLEEGSRPLLDRQWAIGNALEINQRYTGRVRDLDPLSLLKLLYCSDRDAAHTAHSAIEASAASHLYTYSLSRILRDNRHPYSRTAQWCVLDLYEDFAAFCKSEQERNEAIGAIRDFLWNAPDDLVRCAFKAGVVLGGHVPSKLGRPVLVECLRSPSRYGRRSAIHGLFHIVEWEPSTRESVIEDLRAYAESETDADLRRFALGIADDLEQEHYDHLPEPIFAGE